MKFYSIVKYVGMKMLLIFLASPYLNPLSADKNNKINQILVEIMDKIVGILTKKADL